MTLHILFHVVECLVIPAIILAVHEQTTHPTERTDISTNVTIELSERVLDVVYFPLRQTGVLTSYTNREILPSN